MRTELRTINHQRALQFRENLTALRGSQPAGLTGFVPSNFLHAELDLVMRSYYPQIYYTKNPENIPLEKLKPLAQKVDMQKIIDSNPQAEIIFFGEDHTYKNGQKLIASQIELLASLGFKTFGSELLHVDEAHLVQAFEEGDKKEEQDLHSYIAEAKNKGYMAQAADTHGNI